MPSRPSAPSGYTLIELLIYIAIVAALIAAVSSVVFTLLNGKAKLLTVGETNQNSRAAMDRMTLAVRNADAITAPAAGATGTALVLQMPDASVNPTQFSLVNGAIQMREGASAASALTADEVTVRGLVFRNLTATGAPGTIRIEMAVSSTNPSGNIDYEYGQTYRETVNVRKRL